MHETNSEDTSMLLFMLLEYERQTSEAPWTSWRLVIYVRLPVYERFSTHFIGSWVFVKLS